MHSFQYKTDDGYNTVQLLETDKEGSTSDKENEEFNKSNNTVEMSSNYLTKEDFTSKASVTDTGLIYTSHSQVVGCSGGTINFFGCSLSVPKDSLKQNHLIRVSIVNHASFNDPQNLFVWTKNKSGKPSVFVTPTLRLEPANLSISKPMTVTLSSCVSVEERHTIKEQEDPNAQSLNKKPDNPVIVQQKSKIEKGRENWKFVDSKTSRDEKSVSFSITQLGDIRAIQDSSEEGNTVVKRISMYIFRSNAARKSQFLSVLLTDDLPHIEQIALQKMPDWLEYIDSVHDISVLENKKLSITLKTKDNLKCSFDKNEFEIPEETLWRNDFILRNNFKVLLHERNTACKVQVILNNPPSTQLAADFVWQEKGKDKPILPQLISIDSNPEDHQS